MEEDYKKLLPADFDFEAFQKEAIKKLKAGKPLSGKDGVMMPLIKRIVEENSWVASFILLFFRFHPKVVEQQRR